MTIFLILIALTFNYSKKYWEFDVADDEIVIYNPFYDTYDDFIKLTEALLKAEHDHNKESVNCYSLKIIDFRNSFNERQQEKLYSSGTDYWRVKCNKLLFYSKSYENIGNIDSSISVLTPALNKTMGYKSGVHERFFKLKMKKYSKQIIKNEINKNFSNNHELNCAKCLDRAFIFQGVEIGFNWDEEKTMEQNKNEFLTILGLQ